MTGPYPHSVQIGSRVIFYPGPRSRRPMTGRVLRWRNDPRGGMMGWLDVACDDGVERSVRPNGCEAIDAKTAPPASTARHG